MSAAQLLGSSEGISPPIRWATQASSRKFHTSRPCCRRLVRTVSSRVLRKIHLKMPTLEEDQLITAAAESDLDALPLTDEQMNAIVPMRVLRGRPKLANKKQLVSIRYSPEVIDYFRASRAGWQARMDAVLKEYVEAHSTVDAKGA